MKKHRFISGSSRCGECEHYEGQSARGLCGQCKLHGFPVTMTLSGCKDFIDRTEILKSYRVITLCGSTRFKDKFIETRKKLTLEGNIVLSPEVFGHSGDTEALSEETKKMLDDLHLAKIDLSSEIYVINVGGYIGESTSREIEYAKSKNKIVKYYEAK